MDKERARKIVERINLLRTWTPESGRSEAETDSAALAIGKMLIKYPDVAVTVGGAPAPLGRGVRFTTRAGTSDAHTAERRADFARAQASSFPWYDKDMYIYIGYGRTVVSTPRSITVHMGSPLWSELRGKEICLPRKQLCPTFLRYIHERDETIPWPVVITRWLAKRERLI